MAGKFNEQVAQTAAVTCKDCGAGGCAGLTGLTECKGDPCVTGMFYEQVAQSAFGSAAEEAWA